ncbi:lysostaphin resistance A-like protein [Salipaludibacillus sp. CF4.18]|uniref:CPBP family intramembrane glutamic endopeptidase n=1 Tax=Salipaludibacillus sp. CF4.18 TaxID=3373081 RepID=UPI003EE5E054
MSRIDSFEETAMVLMRKYLSLSILALFFFLGIVVTAFKMWFGIIAVLLCLLFMYVFNTNLRFITSIFISFIVSLSFFQLISIFIHNYNLSTEVEILLNRSLLLILVLGILLTHLIHKKKLSFLHRLPEWNKYINLPFHTIRISSFLLVVFFVNVLILSLFIFQQEINDIQTMLFFGLLFSIINATLEEFLWRGILLSSLARYVSVSYAIIITSIGFGLMHLVIDMPILLCIVFSFGGFFYSVLVLKTKSIYPTLLIHFMINMGMVLSGWIGKEKGISTDYKHLLKTFNVFLPILFLFHFVFINSFCS